MSANENIIANDTIVIVRIYRDGDIHREVGRVLDNTIRKGNVEYLVRTAGAGTVWFAQAHVTVVDI